MFRSTVFFWSGMSVGPCLCKWAYINMDKLKRIIALAVIIILFSSSVFADVVIMKDGQRIKGLILDEFKDRVVVSTVEGEKTIMVSDIRSAIYSSEEKALMQKARNHEKRRQEIEAYYTYEKVLDIDPDLTEAKERRNYLRSYIEIGTRQKIMENMTSGKTAFDSNRKENAASFVAQDIGIALIPGGKYVQVARVTKANVLDRIKPGDKIVAVWSEMTAYMDVGEVSSMMLVPGEVRLEIERTTFPTLSYAKSWIYRLLFSSYKEAIGAGLELYTKGVIVKDIFEGGPFQEAGIANGDLVYRINGKNTRYIPMKRIVETLMADQGKQVEVVVRRNVTLWKKGEGE